MIPSVNATDRSMKALIKLADESRQQARIAELSDQPKLAVEYLLQADDLLQVSQMLAEQNIARTAKAKVNKPSKKCK